MKPTCIYGSNHFFGMIKKFCNLSDELKNILDPVLQRNVYFCHPETILLAMLLDKIIHIRELSLRRNIKCRESYDSQVSIRPFKVPNLILNAGDYVIKVCGNKIRDGVIQAKLTFQCDLPMFETKKHFISSLK